MFKGLSKKQKNKKRKKKKEKKDFNFLMIKCVITSVMDEESCDKKEKNSRREIETEIKPCKKD